MIFQTTLFLLWLNSHPVIADTASLRTKFQSLKIDAVFPGDPTYKQYSAAYNLRLAYMPAAVVFPNDKEAVANAVKVAVEEQIPVASRSGGHSYAAYGLGGANGVLVVDLSRLKKISVDSSTGRALVETGNRLGDMAIALNSQGTRALPCGTGSYVGIGGHAAFAGFGFTSRMWGLTLDAIIGHEVVLANGSIITTSNDQHPDLFWGLRGAGASFGIMTAIDFQTHPSPTQATNFAYSWESFKGDFSSALIKFQTFCLPGLPAELGIEAKFDKETRDGKFTFSIVGVWYGESRALADILRPFLSSMPAPDQTSVKTLDWIASLEVLAEGQNLSSSGVDLTAEHDTFYAKSLITPQQAPMSDTSLRAFSKYLVNEGFQHDVNWFIQFELYGGKQSVINSVGKDDTAFAHRSSLFVIQFYASSYDNAPFPDAGYRFLDNMVASIVGNNPPGWQYGAYTNYVDDRLTPAQWKAQYYNSHYQRLTHIKMLYDPKNVFSNPQSITEQSE